MAALALCGYAGRSASLLVSTTMRTGSVDEGPPLTIRLREAQQEEYSYMESLPGGQQNLYEMDRWIWQVPRRLVLC